MLIFLETFCWLFSQASGEEAAHRGWKSHSHPGDILFQLSGKSGTIAGCQNEGPCWTPTDSPCSGQGAMGMAINDRRKFRRRRIEIKVFYLMKHIEKIRAILDHTEFRVLALQLPQCPSKHHPELFAPSGIYSLP